MKLWSLPLRRLAFGQNRPGAWFAALLVGVLCSLPLAPAGAQQATYFYAGTQKVPLTPASNWSGVQVASGQSAAVAASGAKAMGGKATDYARRNIVLFSKGSLPADTKPVRDDGPLASSAQREP